MTRVFISYKSEDQEAADRLCTALESRNIACWIAHRDIPASAEWPIAIAEAIGASKVFVLVLSAHSIQEKQISREVELADKHQCQIVTFRIDNVEPPPALSYFLGDLQWQNAFGDQFDAAVARVLELVEKGPEMKLGALPTPHGSSFPGELSLGLSGPSVGDRSDFNGDWLSLSQTGETVGAVKDTVTIAADGGKIHLRNKGNIGGFVYEAVCDVYEGMTLVGPWRSVRRGAMARGYLLLQIASQGQYMYGVYSDICSDGRHMLLGWVLGRDEESLTQAVEALRSSSSIEFNSATAHGAVPQK
jgi:hypothetical protein